MSLGFYIFQKKKPPLQVCGYSQRYLWSRCDSQQAAAKGGCLSMPKLAAACREDRTSVQPSSIQTIFGGLRRLQHCQNCYDAASISWYSHEFPRYILQVFSGAENPDERFFGWCTRLHPLVVLVVFVQFLGCHYLRCPPSFGTKAFRGMKKDSYGEGRRGSSVVGGNGSPEIASSLVSNFIFFCFFF